MDIKIKERFQELWAKYFGDEELPLTWFYVNEQPSGVQMAKAPTGQRCVIGDIAKARAGKSIALTADTIGCGGGKRYLGYSRQLFPNFEYFLSCGIPGKMEGERYKKTPELAKEAIKFQPPFNAPGQYIVFKRWDRLEEKDDPEVAVFFARTDVLSGLFALVNFDEAEPNGVISPMAAGCGSIVQFPFAEKDAPRPRAVLGMFDVSARPSVPADVLTLAIPMKKLTEMIANIEESFLITSSWGKVKRRIKTSRTAR